MEIYVQIKCPRQVFEGGYTICENERSWLFHPPKLAVDNTVATTAIDDTVGYQLELDLLKKVLLKM